MKQSKTQTLQPSFVQKHKVLLIVTACVSLLIIIPVLYIGWLGFMPGVSSAFGSDKPRDLGVRYNNDDLQTYNQKTSVVFVDSAKAPVDPANPSQKQAPTNPKSAQDLVLSEQEVTASINSLLKTYNWLPLQDIQVKFANGVVEVSGLLNLDKVDDFNAHVSGQENVGLHNAVNWAKLSTDNVPFYAKATASVENNTVTYTIDKAEIGRAEVPRGWLGQAKNQAKSTATIRAENFRVDHAALSNGNLTFSGLYPTTIYIDQ